MAQTVYVNKPKGGMTTSASLFNLYKEFDSGAINVDKFTERMETDIGLKPTVDFESYMRTTKGQNKCEFRKIQQSLKVGNHKAQPIIADVRPVDIKFHRGQAGQMATVPHQTTNPRQVQLSQAIKDYTAGRSDLGQFRLALAGKVEIDGRLERMLRQHEAGDSVSFAQFGTLVFRQLDGQCETYNRVDKVSMNDPGQAQPALTGQRFLSPDNAPKRKKRVTDQMQQEAEWRNSTGVYQQTRGGPARNDIFGSSLFNIINQEESRRTGGDREWQSGRKPKNVMMQTSDASLFGWDVEPAANSTFSPRSSYSQRGQDCE